MKETKLIHLNVKAFKLHKIDEDFDSCHDNYAIDLETNRFAIADGVAKSFEPAFWSKLLVEKFVKDSGILNSKKYIDDWLESIRTEWQRLIDQKDWEKVQYFVRNRKNEPALSTFLGLEFSKREIINEEQIIPFQFFNIGDTCLFHYRNGEFVKAWNYSSASDFNDYPNCLNSKKIVQVKISKKDKKQLKVTRDLGEAKLGDRIILATDGVAKWIFENIESKKDELNNKLFQIGDIDAFDKFIFECKSGDHGFRMDDDDSTLLQIDFEFEKKEPYVQPKDWKTNLSKNQISNEIGTKDSINSSTTIESPFGEMINEFKEKSKESHEQLIGLVEKFCEERWTEYENFIQIPVPENSKNDVRRKKLQSRINEIEEQFNNKEEVLKEKADTLIQRYSDSYNQVIKEFSDLIDSNILSYQDELENKLIDTEIKKIEQGAEENKNEQLKKKNKMLKILSLALLLIVLGMIAFYLWQNELIK